MLQLISSIESCKFSRVTSLKFAIAFLHITYPDLKIQEYSVITHENDSSTEPNY